MPNELKKGKNSTIEEITLKNWEEFEHKVEQEYLSLAKLKKENSFFISNFLFRGQANKFWRLETTLERYVKGKNVLKQEYSWEDYYGILKSIKPSIHSLAEYKPKLGKFFNQSVTRTPDFDEFMIYVRHHGFPSPLLDWTRSPYVAAYFAFNDSKKDEDVAIYSYLENKGEPKLTRSNNPKITTYGLSAERKHKRHYQQQGEYTVCFTETTDKENTDIYTSHEKVEFGDKQDFLKKYIIPSTERKNVLRKLDLMNINAFSLFGSEEGLMSMLAYREIEKEQ